MKSKYVGWELSIFMLTGQDVITASGGDNDVIKEDSEWQVFQ